MEKVSANHTGSKERITERDAFYLRFLAKYPAADAEAMSFISLRGENPFRDDANELTSIAGIEKRMNKLVRLGAVSKFKSPISGRKHFGITELGHEAVLFYGREIPAWRGIEGLSISRLEHYRSIALVAAQLISPINFFEDTLKVPAFSLADLVSENEMRARFEAVKQDQTKRDPQANFANNYPSIRGKIFSQTVEKVNQGTIQPSQIDYEKLFFTIGSSEANAKKIHQPDLAIMRPRKGTEGTNWLIEVERTSKTLDEYRRILLTFGSEFREQTCYQRAIYFTNNSATTNLIKRADEGLGLIKSGRLMILPLTGRTGQEKPANRVVVPKAQPATVPNQTNGFILPELN